MHEIKETNILQSLFKFRLKIENHVALKCVQASKDMPWALLDLTVS